MSSRVKVAFCSCFLDHIPAFLDRFNEIAPDSELWVVSEFPPPRGRWVPYRIDRSAVENLAALRAALGGREITYVAISLQPRAPYGAMRRTALRIAPFRTLLYNENLDHFTLRPRSWPAVLRYLTWKTSEYIDWQIHPGGQLYTFAWRVRHPREFRRPLAFLAAKKAGRSIAVSKSNMPSTALEAPAAPNPAGNSVIIPSRNGKELLSQLLPLLDEADEIIVVDNGSNDRTAEYVRKQHPRARLEISDVPLSFAKAVNRGIAAARFSRVLLLNNDMQPHAGFFAGIAEPFTTVPDLFCATAQIFFPGGRRREETGKAVMPPDPGPHEFPVRCGLPLAGENGSYVLYGSGGCSLYDTAKLKALGGFSEIFEPAYVEDLDLGFRAWQRGWPTVFAAGAHVTHHHRATTSRYFTPQQLEQITERNYLRFVAHSVGDANVFTRLWRHAIERLNWKAAVEHHAPSLEALVEARTMSRYVRAVPRANEEHILAIGSGDVAVFPGHARPASPLGTVLIASAYSPFPLSHGGAVRMFNLMRRAASQFAQVLITFVDELHTPPAELLDICVEIVQVKRVGSHVRPDRGRPDVVEEFDTAAFRAALHQTLRKWKPAIAQLEFTQMAIYGEDCAPAKTVMVEHDVTIDLYRQLLQNKDDWELRRQLDRWTAFETQAWRNSDCVVVMSDKDHQTIVGAQNVVTLPNGVDIDRFRPTNAAPETDRLLFIGSFAHLPNVLALDFFLRKVWPLLERPRLKLHVIAGMNHRLHFDRWKDRIQFPLDHPGLELEDFVPDVRPAYVRAALVIAPLLASAGTNIKIMEAMAMGKPIVSTTGGVNGLDLQHSTSGVVIENDPARFAEAITTLLEDEEQRKELGRRARATVEARFNWDNIAEQQTAMYLNLIRS